MVGTWTIRLLLLLLLLLLFLSELEAAHLDRQVVQVEEFETSGVRPQGVPLEAHFFNVLLVLMLL